MRNVQGQFTERTLRANWIPSARTLNSSPYLTASIARTSVYSQFLLHYYPRSPTWWKTACTWVMEAFDGRHQFVPLQAAAGALGTTVIALVHGNNDFREYGLQLYGKALRDLRRANQFAYEYRWFDLLLTSMLLLSYEVSHWPIHAQSRAIVSESEATDSNKIPSRCWFQACQIQVVSKGIVLVYLLFFKCWAQKHSRGLV